MEQLCNAALPLLKAETRPAYDRAQLRGGIVHIGPGGFHRAHQLVYLQELLKLNQAFDWAYTEVGVMEHDTKMVETLRKQDGLYTLAVRHADGHRDYTVQGPIVAALHAPSEYDQVMTVMTAPETRIVSLTITEGGYNLKGMDPRPLSEYSGPGTGNVNAFRLMVQALVQRKQAGIGPFTVQSCDNVMENGDIARAQVVECAKLIAPEYAQWIAEEVAFPCCMVDRITPVTLDADRQAVAEATGVRDDWPVTCEPYIQWIMQDNYSAGRPQWEAVGVQFVADVVPYEHMKLRLLNAAHQVIGNLGSLGGFEYVHEVCQDPDYASFVLNYMRAEAIPTLAEVPGIDLEDYTKTLLERFSNASIADTNARQCQEAGVKMSRFLVPVVRDNLARCQAGQPWQLEHAALTMAGWACTYLRRSDTGVKLGIADEWEMPLRQAMGLDDEYAQATLGNLSVEQAQELAVRAAGLLDYEPTFGQVGSDIEFKRRFVYYVEQLLTRPVREVVKQVNG